MPDHDFRKKTFKEDVKLTAICEHCGKPVRQLRKGSFTAWIFGDNSCTCNRPQLSTPNLQPVTEESAKPESLPLPFLGTQYEVISRLGHGGMGSVYLAKDTLLKETFALKVLREDFARDRQGVKRFLLEAEAASKLSHANLVQVFNTFETKDGLPCIVMEYAPGADLGKVLEREINFSVNRALAISLQLCEALQAAHKKGVIHRDVKPSNIILNSNDNGIESVKVVDFGIAKVITSVAESNSLTQTGDLIGTPLYMSPEQCQGEELDERSDIYSVGCVIYEMLTGKPPFVYSNPVKVILSHIGEAPVRPSLINSEVKTDLESIILRCLAKEPEMRYQTIDELFRDLSLFQSDSEPQSIFATTSDETVSKLRSLNAQVADGVMKVLLTLPCLLLVSAADKGETIKYFAAYFGGGDPAQIWILLLVALAVYLNSILVWPAVLAFVIILCAYPPDFQGIRMGANLQEWVIAMNLLESVALCSVINWLYDAILESRSERRTIGQSWNGLEVVPRFGIDVNFVRASLRHLGKALMPLQLVILPFAAVFGIGGLRVFRKPIPELLSECKVKRRSRKSIKSEAKVSLKQAAINSFPTIVPVALYCALPALMVPFLNHPICRLFTLLILCWYIFGFCLQSASKPMKGWFLIFALPVIMCFSVGPQLLTQVNIMAGEAGDDYRKASWEELEHWSERSTPKKESSKEKDPQQTGGSKSLR